MNDVPRLATSRHSVDTKCAHNCTVAGQRRCIGVIRLVFSARNGSISIGDNVLKRQFSYFRLVICEINRWAAARQTDVRAKQQNTFLIIISRISVHVKCIMLAPSNQRQYYKSYFI